MRGIIASLKIIAFVFLCLFIVPPQIVALFITKGPASRILPHIWMKCVVFVFGIHIHLDGTPYKERQVLYMSNHLSYLDIIVLGSLLKCSFVSKNDVAKWPVFGFLAGLRQTAYIGRAKGDLKTASKAVSSFIERGEDLIIFPEGTSTDGQEVIPFKSSLFSLALSPDKPDLHIQGITLHVLYADKKTIETQSDRDLYAWHRNMDDALHTHLWRFAKARGAHIKVIFHDPKRAHDFEDRKTLAKAVHKTVSNGLQNSIIDF